MSPKLPWAGAWQFNEHALQAIENAATGEITYVAGVAREVHHVDACNERSTTIDWHDITTMGATKPGFDDIPDTQPRYQPPREIQ